MNSSLRKRLVVPCKIGLAAGIVIFVIYRNVDLQELSGRLRGVSWKGILPCWAAYGALWLLSAWRWRVLVRIQGIGVRYVDLLRYCFIGLFFNNIMLGAIGGDLLKAYYLARAAPGRGEVALISVIGDRTVGFLTFFCIGFAGIVLNGRNPNLRAASWLFFLFFAATCGGLMALYSKDFIKRIPFAEKMLSRLPFEDNVRRFYRALYVYRTRLSGIGRAMLVSLVLQLVTIGIVYRIARMMGMTGVGYQHLLLFVPFIATVCAIPVTPSGWGTGEFAYCKLFGAIGIPADQALALDLVVRAILISWSLVGGMLYAFPQWRMSAPEEWEKQC